MNEEALEEWEQVRLVLTLHEAITVVTALRWAADKVTPEVADAINEKIDVALGITDPVA